MKKEKVQVKLLGGKVRRGENDASFFPFKDHQILEPSICLQALKPSIGHCVRDFPSPLSFSFFLKSWIRVICVATLALGLWSRQGLARVQAKREARKSHLMLLGVQKSVREWTFTFPSELSFWELEFQWTFESSKGDCRGKKPLD